MTVRDALAAANRRQQTLIFKIIASVVVTVAALGLYVAYTVAAEAARRDAAAVGAPSPAPAPAPAPAADSHKTGGPTVPTAEDTALETGARILEDVLTARADSTSAAVSILLGWAVAMAAIWLGLALTYLALGALAATLLGAVWLTGLGRDYIPVIGGVLVLLAAFAAFLRLLRWAFAAPTPVFAIARNVLIEASRLRVSIIFLIALVFLLATLPGLLNSDQPLRYRVQAFLQYSIGGSFWLIAAMTILFSCATVGFDQRDRTIWQTVTKPVRPWQYILGKWLGVVGFAAVLLCVCSSGVFLFTEHLRTRPAQGEQAAYIAGPGGGVSEDRFLLETQVLAARVQREPDPLPLDDEQFQRNVEARVSALITDFLAELPPGPERTAREAELRDSLRRDLNKSIQLAYRAIEPGQREGYVFSGLAPARNASRPLFLRFKINAGSNPPDQTYRVSFQFRNSEPVVREIGLGQMQTFPILPTIIDEDGAARLMIVNGDIFARTANPETINLPPDGFEISYSDGSFAANFFRVAVVLWVKIAFLAMVAVFCSTFMSFPVACIVSFAVFLSAESAQFLLSSLETFATEDRAGKPIWHNVVISWITLAVGTVFKVYGDLRPTARLVEGLKLSAGSVAAGTAVLSVWTLILYAAATAVFRRRELATYSGH